MNDQNKQQQGGEVVDVLVKLQRDMVELAKKYEVDLWFNQTSKFLVLQFMFDNGKKDVTIEVNVKEMLDQDLDKYMADVEEWIVDIFEHSDEAASEVTEE